MNLWFAFFCFVLLAATTMVCLGLIALGVYGTLWLIGHGHMEVKVGQQAEADAREGATQAHVDWRVARPDAKRQGVQNGVDASARRVRLYQPGRRGDHVS